MKRKVASAVKVACAMLHKNTIKLNEINVFDSLFDDAVVVDGNDMENAHCEPYQNSSNSAKVLAINFILTEVRARNTQ